MVRVSADAPDRKEWVKASRAATGQVVVTVTLMEGNVSAKWAVKSYASGIKTGVTDARAGAGKALDILLEATK